MFISSISSGVKNLAMGDCQPSDGHFYICQALCSVYLRKFGQIVYLLAGHAGTALGIEPLDDPATGHDIGKDLESGIL